MQSLQPKNLSDLHILQIPFTCEMLLNLPHVLTSPWTYGYFSVLWWKNSLWLLHVITKDFVKTMVFCLFSLLWWKTVYLWSLVTLSSTQHFFPSGAFHAQGVDIHSAKMYGFQVKFSKNGWWCYHREGFECKKQHHFTKKNNKSLDPGQIWVKSMSKK